MGRKPLPTAILRFRGSEKARLREHEPEGSSGPPVVLPWVASDERARWYFDRLIEDLRRLGVYAAEDFAAQNRYAHCMAEFERAEAEVQANGMVIESPQGKKDNPARRARDDAWAEASKIGREFGLTPASRVGLVSSRKQSGSGGSAISAYLKSQAS